MISVCGQEIKQAYGCTASDEDILDSCVSLNTHFLNFQPAFKDRFLFWMAVNIEMKSMNQMWNSFSICVHSLYEDIKIKHILYPMFMLEKGQLQS